MDITTNGSADTIAESTPADTAPVAALTSIKINLAEVMENLKLVSSYLAGKREESAVAYDRVAAIDVDAPVVGLLMEDAALRVASVFPGPLLRWRYMRNVLTFDIEGECDAEGLRSTLLRVVCLEVLRRWLRLTGSDYADTVAESATEAADSLSIHFPALKAAGEPGNTGEDDNKEPDEWLPTRKIASRRRLPPM